MRHDLQHSAPGNQALEPFVAGGLGLDALQLLSTLRLASPALPIGGFSYSQALEQAIERGWVHNESTAADWLTDILVLNLAHYEWPLSLALYRCLPHDLEQAERWHQDYLCSRETAELRAETEQMGRSLLHLLGGLSLPAAVADEVSRRLDSDLPCALPMAWGLAAAGLGVPPSAALAAQAWAWLENQIMAALKAVPLGQQTGQRLFSRLLPAVAKVLHECEHRAENPQDWHNLSPGLALASAWHETQYSRLFRS